MDDGEARCLKLHESWFKLYVLDTKDPGKLLGHPEGPGSKNLKLPCRSSVPGVSASCLLRRPRPSRVPSPAGRFPSARRMFTFHTKVAKASDPLDLDVFDRVCGRGGGWTMYTHLASKPSALDDAPVDVLSVRVSFRPGTRTPYTDFLHRLQTYMLLVDALVRQAKRASPVRASRNPLDGPPDLPSSRQRVEDLS